MDDALGIQRVVDINPEHQGSSLREGGQQIVVHEEFVEDRPDVVVVMNVVDVAEAKDQSQGSGPSPEVLMG